MEWDHAQVDSDVGGNTVSRVYTLKELTPVFNFIGYGNLEKAPVWFLGPEEAGDLGTLAKRLAFEPIEDLKDAHVSKLNIGKHHDMSGKFELQTTWGGMCHVMLHLHDQEPTCAAKSHYQANELGRRKGETFLLELLPMPNKKLKC